MRIDIQPPAAGHGAQTRAVIDALPDWFGIPEANDGYVAFAESHPTWTAVTEDGDVVGVLTEQHHNQGSREIHLLAVVPSLHREGIGRRLVEAFEGRARGDDVRVVHVKTLGPSHPDEGYALTRRFYDAMGYLPLEETTALWDGTPALLMVKSLIPMGESAAIARWPEPVTVEMVLAALHAVGVRHGDTVIAHASLSAAGWVVGDGQALLDALVQAVGAGGTVVVPAQTGYSDPSEWQNPPVPEAWWQQIRDHWPVFDPWLTPLRSMGALAECVHRHRDAESSGHPSVGFLALGTRAGEITAGHPVDHRLDDESPLGRLYALDAKVVLIGVGHVNNTSLHLAEARAGVLESGDDFDALGAAFEAEGKDNGRRAPLGATEVMCCSMQALVDFGARWLTANRR